MPSYLFTWLALGWVLSLGWDHPVENYRIMARVVILGIAIAFIYWLPIYLGIPLSAGEYGMRMIFSSWI